MRTNTSQRHLASLLGATLGLAGLASAQSTLYTMNGDKANDRLGASVANAGDVNGDGFNDVLVGAPENFNVFLSGEGYARVYSGANGLVLGTVDGVNLQDASGHDVAGLGDVNGDGFGDFLVGARLHGPVINQQGQVRVISGQTMGQLYDVVGSAVGEQLGWSVSGCGDVDGDGVADFVAGGPTDNGNQGIARVFSGVNGTEIHAFHGSVSNGRLGYSVGNLGDVNGDGRADILVGSLFEGVYVYSGMDGSELRHFTTFVSDDIYGKSVAGIDDMNNDGVRDILIGATQESIISNPPGAGYVEIRSGASGALLLTINGTVVNDRFGNSVSDAGDWNGDSKPDVIVGSVPNTAGVDSYATIHSGVDGSVLATFTGDNPGDGMGFDVAGLGDVNGDGKMDVVCGAPDTQPAGIGSGRARVFSSTVVSCGGKVNYCVGAPNSVGAGMSMSGIGNASVSSVFFLSASGGPANQPGLFFYGAGQAQVPFGNGFRCVSGQLKRLPILNIGAGGTANFLLDFQNLPQAIQAGETWNFQLWYRDPAGGGANFNLSDGLSVSFCP